MLEPTTSIAALSLAETGLAAAGVRSGAYRYIAWLAGLAAATPLLFTAIGLASTNVGITAAVIAFAAVVATLSIALLLPSRRVAVRGLSTRFGLAVGSWGVLLALGLGLGLGVMPGASVWLWMVAGFAAAVPLVLGAVAEARA